MKVLCRYRPHWKMDLHLRPFFLGGVMKASGNRPPMMVPAKALYMQKDLSRNAKYFGIPLKPIEVFFLKCRLNVKQVKNFLFFMSRPNSLKAMKIVKIISLFLLLFRILFILWLKKEL